MFSDKVPGRALEAQCPEGQGHWQPFRDLKIKFVGSFRAEQLSLRSQQRIVTTVEDSVLRTEMPGLESQEEDAPKYPLL